MNPSSDEGLNSVFNSLVEVANNARLYFTQGSIPEALHRLQEVKRTIEYLEHRLPEQERAQRSSGRTESPQAGLAIHAKPDRQHDQGRGSISYPSHTTHSGPPYSGPPQHLPSFKGPPSGAGGGGGGGGGGGTGYGQGYTSGSTSAGSLSRSGTVSDPGPFHPQHHGPGPSDYRERPTIQTNLSHPALSGPRSYGSAGRDHQEDSRDSRDPRDSRDSRDSRDPRDSRRYPPPPLTAPVSSSSSSSSSSLWSSPRAPIPQQHAEHGSSPGGTAGPFRQRHTSLPQVLNYSAPALPSPTREHPPPSSYHSQHSQHHHHHHQPPQQPHQQYQAQHSHQPHHSSSQPQPPPHHQPHYPTSTQQHGQQQHGQQQQQHGQQQQQHGRAQYQQAPPTTGQSTFHQESPRIPHRYDGPLSSPRGGYFQEQPTSPRTGRLSSDRVPETIEEQLYYREHEDRRHDRKISQGGPSPAHTPDHRARISSLVHPQDTRDVESMHTPPRRGSGGAPHGQSGTPSSSSSSSAAATKGHVPFASNGSTSGSAIVIHGPGPSPPQQHLQHLHYHHHHHHPTGGSASSPTTATPRGSRHSLTVTTLGSPLPVTASGNSSTLLHASALPATATTTPTVTTRGDNTGSRTQFHAPLEPEVIARLDDIFFKFLQRICSDLKASDSKGDHIHQPLMAKKMQRLEASTEFRPFKFRIQAFTNAFHDSLILHGLTEDILPLRKVKVYLWKHRYISRFNEDGKKQKSKGNHVWNIEARRIGPLIGTQPTDSGNASSADSTPASATTNAGPSLPPTPGISIAAVGEGSVPIRWEFREYSSRIAGQIIKFARVGIPYVYSPRIWDAQMSCPDAKFSSPWLPGWLKWKKGELKGIPGPDDESCEITVIAEYVREGEECKLDMSFPLTVSDPSKEGELMDSQNEQEPENENELENEDEDELEDDDDQDREQNNGHSKQRTMTTVGRKTQVRQKLQPKKPRLSKQPKQQQQPLLSQQGPAPSRPQQYSPPQHRHSYSSQGAAGTTRQAASGGDGDEEQGSSYDDEEDDDMDQEMMDEEDEIDDTGDDDDEMDYVDNHIPPRKKSRERRSLILVKDSQDPKRRKQFK